MSARIENFARKKAKVAAARLQGKHSIRACLPVHIVELCREGEFYSRARQNEKLISFLRVVMRVQRATLPHDTFEWLSGYEFHKFLIDGKLYFRCCCATAARSFERHATLVKRCLFRYEKFALFRIDTRLLCTKLPCKS